MIAGPFLKSNRRSGDINKIYKGLSMKNIRSALTILISIFVLVFAALAHTATQTTGTYGPSVLEFARGLMPSENANTVAGTSNSVPVSGPCTQPYRYRTVTGRPDGIGQGRYIAVYSQACIF